MWRGELGVECVGCVGFALALRRRPAWLRRGFFGGKGGGGGRGLAREWCGGRKVRSGRGRGTTPAYLLKSWGEGRVLTLGGREGLNLLLRG